MHNELSYFLKSRKRCVLNEQPIVFQSKPFCFMDGFIIVAVCAPAIGSELTDIFLTLLTAAGRHENLAPKSEQMTNPG